jgi:tetratricopeptide (TPR) repeat protein
MGKIKEAQELFSGLIQSADSRYLRSTILENLTLTYNAEQKYEQAAEYLSQAIEHSQKYDILSQLPDECLFLGDLYREKLQQPELATYYYEIGSRAALKMAEHGFSLKGDRLDVVNRFENRPKVGYSLPESLTPKAERFAFADGLTWKQINDLFQFHLIKSHLESGMAIADLPEKLELKSSTYYAIKRRLNQHGYNLSDDLTTAQLKSKHAVSLKSYVNGFQELSWSQANQRFEKEIIEYLFKQVGYHKNKLADELGVSYPTILQKTKSLGQG